MKHIFDANNDDTHLLSNIIKKKLLGRAKVGLGSL